MITIIGTGHFGTCDIPTSEDNDTLSNTILETHNFDKSDTSLYLYFYNLKVPNLASNQVFLHKFYY